MHDVKYVVQNLSLFKENLKKRNFDLKIVDQLIDLNQQWKALTTTVEIKRSELKKLSAQIGALKKEKKDDSELLAMVSKIKKEIEDSSKELENFDEKQKDILLIIPNLVSDKTPLGKSEEDNIEIKRIGRPRTFDFTPLDHVTLGENLGLLDFEVAAKITGSRFSLYRGDLARLERALINFMLDDHGKNGYLEIIPPVIVHERSLIGSGQLPKFKEDLFKLEGRDWYLTPTAEVPLVNMKREELFPEGELPIKLCSYTPCFRSEAGSYGKDTKGLIRLHQFNKVELVKIVSKEKSEEAFEEMVKRASAILEALELPFRLLELSTGDIGFSSHRTIDLEVWLPAQNTYREISSISNCVDFQSRRAGIRYRSSEGRPEYAHTLNGSGLAVGRTVVAIMENFQNKDGSLAIPKILQGYMGGQKVISKI